MMKGKEKLDVKKLRELDVKYFWHPYTQMKFYEKISPPIIVEGKGNWLYDIEGKKYLDATSSIWCIVHGHSVPRLQNTIVKQAKKLQHSTTLGLSHPHAILLAQKLAEITGLDKVFFSEDGAEANEVALKVVFAWWKRQGKTKRYFASPENSYFGDTVGAMSVAGPTDFTAEWKELLFKSIHLPSPYCYRCKWNKGKGEERKCSFECVELAEKTIRKNSDKICAVFVEGGVQGAGGIVPFPEGYLKTVKKLCEEYEIPLVVDEVATGFGKTGKLFGFMWEFDKPPDIITLGKGVSGGYLPLSATVFKKKFYDVFEGEIWEMKHFLHGHTFTANPILCSLSLENINLLLEKLPEYTKVIPYIEKKLSKLRKFEVVGNIRGRGFMWGIEIVKNPETKEKFPPQISAGWQICLSAWKKGVLIRPLGDTVVLNLPLSIKKREIDFLVDVLLECFEEFEKKFLKENFNI